MVFMNGVNTWLILMVIGQVSGVSYNQPKFCPYATWNSNAITFANSSTVGTAPHGMFINTNNTVYVADRQNGRIQIWFNNSLSPTTTISGNLQAPWSIFVTSDGDIYVDNGQTNKRVDKRTLNTNTSVVAMYVDGACLGLFIDVNDSLYCSLFDYHKVIKRWLGGGNANTSTIVAGTGFAGSTSFMFNSPNGIFVDTNFDLYVADFNNNRIQLFRLGQLNGTTVAGNGSSTTTITLNKPTGIMLDADKYLFIADFNNHRIVGSGPNGFRCLVGCTGSSGATSDKLNNPELFSFDSYGNIFVPDKINNRIQKFLLSTNSCEPMTTTELPTSTKQMTSTAMFITTTELPKSTKQMTSTAIFITTTKSITSTKQMTSTAMVTTSKTPIISQTCFSPTVTLIPGASTLSSPLQFRRIQDFYIVSIVQLNCNDSIQTTNQWIIRNCTSTCVNQIQLDPTIFTTFTELNIPARTLPYGIYELQLIVTMTHSPWLKTSTFVYVQITPSGITANLVQLGTSMITSGHEQDLHLDPGSYSIDLDENSFNISNWKYRYYCRIYGLYMFPNLNGLLLTIDDPTIDPSNPSCLSNRTAWKFGNSISSTLIILSGSLQSNRTYQFMVQMENRRNTSVQATGYVLVKVEDTRPQMVAIGCVILTMCVPNLEYQLVNPTTQVALFSLCIGNCLLIPNITWNVYYVSMNSSSNSTQWILFNQTSSFQNIWFFGINTSNFTATNQLFLANPLITLWRFEVVYSFPTETSVSALNFVINQPPVNGSCSISPLNGTTSTSFNMSCQDWFDEDGIKDYSFYVWTTDLSQKAMIAFSTFPLMQIRLPPGNDQSSQLNLIVYIRDQLDCITEYNMSYVTVRPDSAAINDLISNLQNPSNPILQLLASGNQNTVGQVITSLSQQFNKINSESVEKAVSGGIPAASISISSLGSPRSPGISTPFNQTALIEFNKELNSQANVREYLMACTTNLLITTSNSIILQATSLAQLTKATNQLSRTSLITASDRCHQLSLALYSLSTRIAYEDVQTAATQLMQCAANILTAANSPLQQRTNVLDSDATHASTLPDDYETDLESEWSNLNLFVDGNDFSLESIEKGRNLYYQKQLANEITSQVNEIISKLTSTLNIHLNIGQDTIMNTSQVFMSLETRIMESLSNKQIKQVGDSEIRLPSNFQTNLSHNSTVSIRSKMEALAPFGNSKSPSNTNVSRSVSLSIVDQYGNEVPIHTNSSHPIEIIIPRDPNVIIPPMTMQNVTSSNSTPHYQLFNLHFVNITSSPSVSVHLEIHPLNRSVGYLLIYQLDQIPQLNGSMHQIDGWSLLCPSNLTNSSIYTYFIDNQHTQGRQSLVFGLRELNSTEMADYCFNSSITSPPITDQRFNFTSNYELRMYTSGCYYLDKTNQWNSDGLRVGPLTNHDQTQCFSTHLTTFVGGFLVLPEPVNWQYIFANADFMKNKTIYLTVICVTTMYLLLVIYARYKDKKDLEKLGVTPLPDNHPSDQYFYQILVFTGQRTDAGTKSKVHFILLGDNDSTHVRTFADPRRRILQRGGIDSFIMAVPKSLGLLNCIRLWHDNSGEGTSSSSWFLKYLIIRDLQTMEKFHFIAQRWFAVEKDDGKIEHVLPVAGVMEKSEFSYLLSKRAYHSVSDGHLWFSIFSRPPSNKFTRVQRCTCCFVLFILSMFLNIMYYDLKKETQTKNSTSTVGLSLGPLLITPEQIEIGVIVELISLIPSLLLVQIFRRLRSRQKQISPLYQTLYKLKAHLPMKNKVERKEKREWTFPWWFIFIGYGLSVILVGISILFIIARGIEFGDVKTQQWLTSILTAFLSSIFLTQPIKILSLAIFFTFFCRKSDDDKQTTEHFGEDQIALANDEEYLHSMSNPLFTYRSPLRIDRLNEAQVARARQQRLKEIHMWSVIREAFISICFLLLLFVITYSNRTQNSFLQVDHLRKYLLNSRQNDLDFNQIYTIDRYWKWLEDSFAANIRAQQWYNGNTPRNLGGFLNDKCNRLIGWGRMRQLRIKSDLCSRQKMNLTCLYDYSSSNEETNSFYPGWRNTTTFPSNSTINRSFQYQSTDSGGYIYEFRGRLSDIQSNLSALHQFEWIDKQTRAIIIEFSLYNPNVQLFTSVTLLTEFLSTGGIRTHSRFEPMNLELILTSISQLVCTIIYMIFIIYFIFLQIQSLFRLKCNYFRQFWSWIELGIIICSWIAIGIYVRRYHEYSHIGQLFQKTKGYIYIDLQLSTYLNDYLTLMYGFCCFFGTVKLIRLCRFNPRLYLFIQTLEKAAKELLSFALMFSIVFVAFICLFYLLFQSSLWTASSVFQTAEMLFEMTLMKFDAYQLIDAAPFLGPFCFSLFILLVVFVCLSMFLTIINESFRQAKENLHDNQQIYSFMLDRFLRWTGLRKATEEELNEERDAVMRNEYYDPIELFSKRIDQLFDALNRIYTM